MSRLSIKTENVTSPRNGVFDSNTGWLSNKPKLKVFSSIIELFAVDVMNILTRKKLPAKRSFHYQPVLVYPSSVHRSNSPVTARGDILAFHASNAPSLSRRAPTRGSKGVSSVSSRSLVVDEAKRLHSRDRFASINFTSWRFCRSLALKRPLVSVASLAQA